MMASENVASGSSSTLRRLRSGWSERLARFGVPALLFVVIAVFSIMLPRTFFTVSNFETMLTGELPVLVLALSLTVTLTVNEFDLSIGAAAAASAVTVAFLAGRGVPLGAIVVITLVGGVMLGNAHWFFSGRIGVNSFIVTLATATLLSGVALLLSNGQTLTISQKSPVAALYDAQLGGVPVIWFAVATLALGIGVVLDRYPLGRNLTFVGQSGDAARLAGLRVQRLKRGAFVVGAILSVGTGFVALSQLGSADPGIGNNFLLPAFAAAYLGSTTVRPGRFNVWGTVCGFYFVNVSVAGLTLLGGAAWVQEVFNGAVLLAAVVMSRMVALRVEGRRS